MIEGLFAQLSLADIHQDLYRNIVSLRKTDNLFDDLSGDSSDWNSAINLELTSKPQVFSSHQPVIQRPFEEAAWNESIDYPFRNWMKSRYSDGSFGVWYGSDTIETTAYETAFHWRFGLLEDAGFVEPGISVERSVYQIRCDAALLDLRDSITSFPALIHPTDYTFTQQVGARLNHEGHPGLTTKSARCGGDMYAMFNRNVLSNPRHSCYLTYTTIESGIRIERKPSEAWFTIL
jgi:hypothetical protein